MFAAAVEAAASTRQDGFRAASNLQLVKRKQEAVMHGGGVAGHVWPGDISLKTSLHVKQIPNELNTREVIGGHFGKFGNVVRVSCFPAKRYATVVFDSHVRHTQW